MPLLTRSGTARAARWPVLVLAVAAVLAACAQDGPRQIVVAPAHVTLSEATPSRAVSVGYSGPIGTRVTVDATVSDGRLSVEPSTFTVAAGRTATVEVGGDLSGLNGTLSAVVRFDSAQVQEDGVVAVSLAPMCFIDPDRPMPATAAERASSPMDAAYDDHVPGQLLVTYHAYPVGRAALHPPDTVARASLTRDVADRAGVRILRVGTGHAHDVVAAPGDDLEAAAARLRDDPRVDIVTRNYVAHRHAAPADQHYDAQWYLSDFGLEGAWQVEDGSGPGTSVVVAIVDDGLNVDHVDLAHKTLPGRDVYCDDADVRTPSNHGTHVAGIAAAGSAPDGVVVGVAKGERVHLLAVKVFPDNIDLGGTLDSVIRGMRWAANLDDDPSRPAADVINLSLGFNAPLSANAAALLQATADEIAARDILMVAAAGNTNGGAVTYPARLPNVVAVGSVDWDFTPSPFSATGPDLDLMAPGGTRTLDTSAICAPGGIQRITGAGAGHPRAVACLKGTSMASPFVAGTAALLIAGDEALRDDPVALVDRLAATALQPPGYTEEAYGFGIVCPDAALGLPTTCSLTPAERQRSR
jgi:subtilisin family serine protease